MMRTIWPCHFPAQIDALYLPTVHSPLSTACLLGLRCCGASARLLQLKSAYPVSHEALPPRGREPARHPANAGQQRLGRRHIQP